MTSVILAIIIILVLLVKPIIITLRIIFNLRYRGVIKRMKRIGERGELCNILATILYRVEVLLLKKREP